MIKDEPNARPEIRAAILSMMTASSTGGPRNTVAAFLTRAEVKACCLPPLYRVVVVEVDVSNVERREVVLALEDVGELDNRGEGRSEALPPIERRARMRAWIAAKGSSDREVGSGGAASVLGVEFV